MMFGMTAGDDIESLRITRVLHENGLLSRAMQRLSLFERSEIMSR
jgi:hypothetical protein